MREIILSSGRGVAKCDDSDYEHLSQFKWQLQHYASGGRGATRGVFFRNGSVRVQKKFSMQGELFPGAKYILHLDFDGLNNQRSNLLVADRSYMSHHARAKVASLSRFKGVRALKGGKFYSSIFKDGTRHDLGAFDSECAAAMAYEQAAERLFGVAAYRHRPDLKPSLL